MKITPKLQVTLQARTKSASHARSDIEIRDLTLTIDEPEARGGTNQGPAPTETALASLIGCTNVIAHKCARKLEVDIGHLTIELEADFDRRGVTLTEEINIPFTAVRMTITSDGSASQEDIDRVAHEVEKFCPISKLFEQAGTDVTATWCRA